MRILGVKNDLNTNPNVVDPKDWNSTLMNKISKITK